MGKQRPVFLNLFRIKFPVTAIVSILHRVSGVAMVLIMPVLLYAAHLGVMTEQSHASFQYLMVEYPIIRLIVWVALLTVMYHALAGFRHMLHDFGVLKHDLATSRATAKITLYLFVLLAVIVGLRLWY